MHKDIKIIATHSGKFHADDLFGVATMKLLYPDAKVIRSRKPDILETADIRIDIGGIDDPATGNFDHHQAGFEKRRDNDIPYASFGLIWKVYGAQLCGSEDIALKIDERLVQPIDAIDNGIDMCDAYHTIFPFNISHTVAILNPSWTSERTHDEAFEVALDIAMTVLTNIIENMQGSAKAESLMQKAVEESGDTPYVWLERYLPGGYLTEHTDKLFVVYPDPNKHWTIKSIPVEKGSFEPRRMFPESWAGLADEELAKVTGVEDAIFCHRGRWICAAKSKEGAKKMLEIALKN